MGGKKSMWDLFLEDDLFKMNKHVFHHLKKSDGAQPS